MAKNAWCGAHSDPVDATKCTGKLVALVKHGNSPDTHV